MNTNILELEGWEARISGFRLGPLNFALKPGRIVALVGPNNAGKTTLFNSLLGLIPPPFKGICRIFGQPRLCSDVDVSWKQELGFVADHPILFESLSLSKNIELISPHYPNWDNDCFTRLWNPLNLPLHLLVSELSKGSRMAFALIMALSYKPRLMLLDEPTAGLDPINRAFFLDEIMAAARGDQQAAVLISTHILSDVARIADEICFIRDGTIVKHVDRETLTEGWCRVEFHCERSLPIHDMAGVVGVDGNNPYYRVVTRSFEAFREELQTYGANISEATPLGLEEVALRQMEF